MRRRTIFIVDDDVLSAQLLSDHLGKNAKNQVEVFGTGEECLRNLHLEPDAIILDYRLNGVNPDAADGLAVLKQIKQVDDRAKVIILSAQEHYGKAVQTIAKGAAEYVVKGSDAFRRIDSILDA